MRVETDFLVIGSGLAGLSFALKAAEKGKVLVLAKTGLSDGATQRAQGGIASVFAAGDSFDAHIADTLTAGAGLCRRDTVEVAVKEGPARVRELIDLGVPFSKGTDLDFPYDLTREGGHSARRILHAQDFTGQAIQQKFAEAVRKNPKIEIWEDHVAIDLIAKSGPCLGAFVLNSKTQRIDTISAKITVLATGGAGKAYLYTSNPDVATGDGIAMAYRAGARVANLEFMQFHPTCLYHPQAKSFLISEALRGEGGELVDASGRAFMKDYHPMGSLAPRDIVARAIDSEMKRQGIECAYLDMAPAARAHGGAEFLRTRFPNIFEECLKFGIDFTKQPIPVVPAAHYTCGGVLADLNGETTVKNLFAVGEVASTGLHGANRLASNSLLEAVVFSDRAAKMATERLSQGFAKSKLPSPLPEWDHGLAVPMEEKININHTWKELRTLMWNYVGIVRTNQRLERAAARLELIKHEVREYYWTYLLTPELIELRNLVTVADLIVQCARSRKESRGLHFNLDYPDRDELNFARDTVL